MVRMKTDIFKGGIRKKRPLQAFKFLLRKYNITLLNIILGAIIVLLIGRATVMEGEYPILTCPACPRCIQTCENQTIVEFEEKVITNYVCPDGVIASDSSDCAARKMVTYICENGTAVEDIELCFQRVNITSKYSSTSNNVTLSIDSIEYTQKGDDWGTITSIAYTVLNEGARVILPYLYVRVYDPEGPIATQSYDRAVIKLSKSLDQNEFVNDEENVYIGFKLNNTLALVARDQLDEKKKILVTTSRSIT